MNFTFIIFVRLTQKEKCGFAYAVLKKLHYFGDIDQKSSIFFEGLFRITKYWTSREPNEGKYFESIQQFFPSWQFRQSAGMSKLPLSRIQFHQSLFLFLQVSCLFAFYRSIFCSDSIDCRRSWRLSITYKAFSFYVH